MSNTLHAATVGVYLQILPQLARLVDKAEAHCRENGLPPTALTDARLAPDMWSFAQQVMCAVRYSADAIDALQSGLSGPYVGPPPAEFAPLREAVEDGVARLRAALPEAVEAAAADPVRYVYTGGGSAYVGEDYLLSFALPNFFFHASMAYAVLRNRGLDVGKRDFLGRPRSTPL